MLAKRKCGYAGDESSSNGLQDIWEGNPWKEMGTDGREALLSFIDPAMLIAFVPNKGSDAPVPRWPAPEPRGS